ncbi:hypothetical protein HMPREF3039_01230 [Akkermansia sp. KLE1798]|nr:hypothetical protein HMPREF3039_01230 [Akkermansia sp. KLE1798]
MVHGRKCWFDCRRKPPWRHGKKYAACAGRRSSSRKRQNAERNRRLRKSGGNRPCLNILMES